MEARMSEIGWLIELRRLPKPSWWDGRGPDTFVLDALDAVRFSRKEDGERVLAWMIKRELKSQCQVLEHGWAPMPLPEPPKGGA